MIRRALPLSTHFAGELRDAASALREFASVVAGVARALDALAGESDRDDRAAASGSFDRSLLDAIGAFTAGGREAGLAILRLQRAWRAAGTTGPRELS